MAANDPSDLTLFKTRNELPGVPRLALTRDEAAAAIGVSVRTIDALIADHTSGFPVIRVGRKVVIPVEPLRDWLHRRMRIHE